MKIASTLIILVSIVIAEAHSYIPEPYASKVENWIRTVDWPMEVWWNAKMLGDEINSILYAFAMFLFIPNRVNKSTAVAFIFLCCVDLIMYLHNAKTLHYGSVYIWALGIWTLAYYLLTKKMQKTWGTQKTMKSNLNRETRWQK